MARSQHSDEGRAVRDAAAEDGSTALPDRRLVLDRLTSALAKAVRSTAVLLADLDDFRMVNVAHGHSLGDELLVAVGERLRAAVSGSETVIRAGDDEFVIICEDTGEHSAHALACFLRYLLAEPFRIDGVAVHVTASVGVAAAAADVAVTPSDLLRRADTALHAGKGAGRGQVHVYDEALGEDEAARHALAADLPAALVGEQLHLEYQTIVDLRTGAVVGLEALSRWTHPTRGPVPPAAFVRVAEQTGAAADLDRWVVRRALADMARLRAAGVVPSDAHLAVNLSAADLGDDDLFGRLLDWTERSGLRPELLVLEITETAIMQDPRCAARLLGRLRGEGFGVAMDDFGTGYSSLAHLRDLPVSALKIDRSFVADSTDAPDAAAIIAWIIDLARAVGVAVVAEGVETTDQADLLRRLGCTTAQGWLWGPALPVPVLLEGHGPTSSREPRRPVRFRPSSARRKRSGADPHGVERLLDLHRDGFSVDAIAATLDAEGFRPPSGRRWDPPGVARLVSERIRRSAGAG